MNLLDIIILFLLVLAIVRGVESGSIRQLCATGGFFIGLFLGAALAPHLIALGHTQADRSWITFGITIGIGMIFLGFGEYIGFILKKKVVLHKRLDKVDRGFGSIVSAAMLLITIWLGSAVVVRLPFQGLQNEIKNSTLISFLNNELPPTPGIIADLSRVIDPNGFPQVFTGAEPAPVNQNTSLPVPAALAAAVNKDSASVVKIQGNGCGGIIEGSGFVVAPGLVATNAHVVAGVSNPQIIDGNGTHDATVIWFDPNLDFAVLETSNLSGAPLVVSTAAVDNGSAAGVLGYPGGGGFNTQPAVILDQFQAIGRNIYGQGATNRSVYEVKATVIPGNSGGPLIALNGSVIGVVFAESTTYSQVGYALTAQAISHELTQAEQQPRVPTSSGNCAE